MPVVVYPENLPPCPISAEFDDPVCFVSEGLYFLIKVLVTNKLIKLGLQYAVVPCPSHQFNSVGCIMETKVLGC